MEKTATLTAPNAPALDDATRDFVRASLVAGVLELDDIKKVVVSLLAESPLMDRDRLAAGLVGAGLLTSWQSKKLAEGYTKGLFLGSYKLLRPLGRGGMGVVYLGEHRVMKRPMALKVLLNAEAKDNRRIDRFQSEARAAAQLDHPNIVRAYDFAEDNGRLFIAMEYVEGIDLQRAVQRDGVLSPEAALDAIAQAAAGLAHAHGRGIVHRDIKPANLLLRSDGVLKISDMGLARIGWQGEETNSEGRPRLIGTSEFLAPEQAIDSRSVDGRADIYSLGCTLYFLLVGSPPYRGATVTERLAKHQTAPPPDIRQLRPDCPAAIAELAVRMMAKRPEDRIPSATELLSQLNRVRALVNKSAQSGTHAIAAKRPLHNIAPASDTIAEDSGWPTQAEPQRANDLSNLPAFDASSLFDLGNLPAIPTPTAPKSPAASRAFPIAASSLKSLPAPATTRQSAAPHASAAASPLAQNQMVLLGVGLALAFIALATVAGLGIYLAMRPEIDSKPMLRSAESNTERPVIVVREE